MIAREMAEHGAQAESWERHNHISGLLLDAVQIFFIGILGEYNLSINSKVIRRPLVIEEKRINYEETEEAAKESAHRGAK